MAMWQYSLLLTALLATIALLSSVGRWWLRAQRRSTDHIADESSRFRQPPPPNARPRAYSDPPRRDYTVASPGSKGSGTQHYLFVNATLTANVWFIVLYAIACVAVVYALALFDDASLLFLTMEVPALVLTSVVLFPNPRLRWRVPFLWILTSALIWGTQFTKPPAEVVGVSCGIILVYALIRAVIGSVREFIAVRNDNSLPTAIATFAECLGSYSTGSFFRPDTD